jgi:error-prone DNA polymerase
MTEHGYVELHARSAFSFLRGSSTPEDLAKAATAAHLPAMALCDRDGVYGAPRFYQAARDPGVKAIVGAEITLADGSALPLLAQSQAGYQNLCQLITAAKSQPRALETITPQDDQVDPRERKRPCFATWAEIARFSEGLIALTGDEEGPVVRAWLRGGATEAGEALRQVEAIFGPDRLYVEMQNHRVRGDERRLRFLADLASARRLPLLATGGVTHATPVGRELADVFTCLRHHTSLDAAGRLLAPNAERHVQSARTMRDRFAEFPEAIANTVRLNERLGFTFANLGYKFPDFAVPAGESQESYLRACTYAGVADRYPGDEFTAKHRDQLERELALINKLGFCGYFLIVWDICRWCRERGILVQGRGSAANSIVCYALRITAIEPIGNKLLFERFLSEGRVGKDGRPSWPDIDLDLPSGDRRESAIQEMYQRYAPRGAAMTANVISYRGRSSTREIGKALGLPQDVLDTFSSLYANGDFPQTLDLEKQLQMAGLPAKHPRIGALARLHQQIRGLPRHLGQHSGGMVISAQPLDLVVPLEPASMDGRVVVQWDKDDCEELGIVKIDFLGLGMMAVLQETFEVCSRRGRATSLEEIRREDDPATYKMMQNADTIGVFQIESRAQMATLPRFRPNNFYDVAMQVSIVRPGPIVGRLAIPLLQRRADEQAGKGREFPCLHPEVSHLLQDVLERTYGVVLFQEQMIAIAMRLAAFSPSDAEELRRAMGFSKGTERLERMVRKLRDAMRAQGHSDEVIEKVIEAAETFGLYGFPEAHAMSFGLLAYASTWLKVHRAAEFFAALLNNQPMGFYAPATLVQDARRHGLKFRPVCVVASDFNSTVEADDVVRIGLKQVGAVRESAVRTMLEQRARRPFTSLDDWLARTIFTAAERRALASVGALNVFAPHRRAALWQVEAAWEAEETLFKTVAGGDASDPISTRSTREPLAPMTLAERYHADFSGTSITTGEHPMALVRAQLPDVWRAADLLLARNGDRVKVAGSVICRQRPGTAKGFVFISLEDETGVANAVVHPDLFEKHRLIITQPSGLSITGRLQNQSGVIHIKAEKFAPLELAELPAGASHDFR